MEEIKKASEYLVDNPNPWDVSEEDKQEDTRLRQVCLEYISTLGDEPNYDKLFNEHPGVANAVAYLSFSDDNIKRYFREYSSIEKLTLKQRAELLLILAGNPELHPAVAKEVIKLMGYQTERMHAVFDQLPQTILSATFSNNYNGYEHVIQLFQLDDENIQKALNAALDANLHEKESSDEESDEEIRTNRLLFMVIAAKENCTLDIFTRIKPQIIASIEQNKHSNIIDFDNVGNNVVTFKDFMLRALALERLQTDDTPVRENGKKDHTIYSALLQAGAKSPDVLTKLLQVLLDTKSRTEQDKEICEMFLVDLFDPDNKVAELLTPQQFSSISANCDTTVVQRLYEDEDLVCKFSNANATLNLEALLCNFVEGKSLGVMRKGKLTEKHLTGLRTEVLNRTSVEGLKDPELVLGIFKQFKARPLFVAKDSTLPRDNLVNLINAASGNIDVCKQFFKYLNMSQKNQTLNDVLEAASVAITNEAFFRQLCVVPNTKFIPKVFRGDVSDVDDEIKELVISGMKNSDDHAAGNYFQDGQCLSTWKDAFDGAEKNAPPPPPPPPPGAGNKGDIPPPPPPPDSSNFPNLTKAKWTPIKVPGATDKKEGENKPSLEELKGTRPFLEEIKQGQDGKFKLISRKERDAMLAEREKKRAEEGVGEDESEKKTPKARPLGSILAQLQKSTAFAQAKSRVGHEKKKEQVDEEGFTIHGDTPPQTPIKKETIAVAENQHKTPDRKDQDDEKSGLSVRDKMRMFGGTVAVPSPTKQRQGRGHTRVNSDTTSNGQGTQLRTIDADIESNARKIEFEEANTKKDQTIVTEIPSFQERMKMWK